MKENEKIDEYLDLARELKKLWNMKMTIVVGAFSNMIDRGDLFLTYSVTNELGPESLSWILNGNIQEFNKSDGQPLNSGPIWNFGCDWKVAVMWPEWF